MLLQTKKYFDPSAYGSKGPVSYKDQSVMAARAIHMRQQGHTRGVQDSQREIRSYRSCHLNTTLPAHLHIKLAPKRGKLSTLGIPIKLSGRTNIGSSQRWIAWVHGAHERLAFRACFIIVANWCTGIEAKWDASLYSPFSRQHLSAGRSQKRYLFRAERS